jgi:hypothetical protein
MLRSTIRSAGLASCLVALALSLALSGCATRSGDVQAEAASPAEFISWDCGRIDDEIDRVQKQAADRAYAVDERAGNNIIAMGVGVTVFWPAMLAMRSNGAEAEDLARLKGRFEALRLAAKQHSCPEPSPDLPAARAAALSLSVGERLVYEDRNPTRGPSAEWVLQLTALRRGDTEFRSLQPLPGIKPAPPVLSDPYVSAAAPAGVWRQDHAGNITLAPEGALQWPHLLRGEMVLGSVTAGDIVVAGDPMQRARMRGQVVAVGPQMIAGRRFDAAVVELFGDAPRGDGYTRVEGVIVVDRASGVLLRLDLRSAQAPFSLLRRLVRVEAPPG